MAFRGMRFCNECDNMLQPKEQLLSDSTSYGYLVYECRICGHPEKAKLRDEQENCVYRSE
jgi:DNA-directed RNA polymerase subunit M/transcription elongation factor TFIIS